MALMEFLKANKANTTTMITVQAGQTGSVSYLFDRNTELGFATVDYNSTTAAVISVVFPEPTVLSTILIQNHNLRQFRIYYNSVTANSLAVVTGNSQTSTYLSFASVTVNSIDIQMDNTIAGGQEKEIGEFIATERRLQFERNPAARDFNPMTKRKRVRHEMSDGGLKIFNIKDKYRAEFKWEYLTSTFEAGLRSVFDDALPLYFCEYPTTTAWDGRAREVLWSNDYDFSYSTNGKDAGFGGKIIIEETPGA